MPWNQTTVESIDGVRVNPRLTFPIRVDVVADFGIHHLRIVVPPATQAGLYTLDVAGHDANGHLVSATFTVTVDAVTVPKAAAAARNPVILLNGFQLICTDTASTLTASMDTFGEMASLLESDGAPVVYFNNCSYGDISIEQLASQLNTYINSLKYTDGTPVTQVDLVAHSMGGLIVRAYLSGKGSVPGSFAPPSNPKVGKFVAIATPHFGSFQAAYIGVQESEMVRGSQFLWDLATWNQGRDDLRGVGALAVVGNAGTYGTASNASDGVVSLTSGSLGFTGTDQQTRIVPYCHITPDGLITGLTMSCSGYQGIADINTPSHLTAQIVRSFLAGTSSWQTIGTTPSQNPILGFDGGAYLTLKGANDVYYTDLTSVSFNNGAGELLSGPSGAIASIFYTEFAAAAQDNFVMNHSNGQATSGSGTISAGRSTPLLFKFGPSIGSVQSPTATGLPGISVESGASIVVSGVGFGNTTATQLKANGALLNITQISDQQITAFLPSSYSGLVQLTVSNANGQQTVNIMAVPVVSSLSALPQTLTFASAVGGLAPATQNVNVTNTGAGSLSWVASSDSPWLSATPKSGSTPSVVAIAVSTSSLSQGTYTGKVTISSTGLNSQIIAVTFAVGAAIPTISTGGIVNNASYASGSVAPGTIVALFGTNLTNGTSCLPPACNPTFAANGRLNTTMTGSQVTFNGIPAPIFYSLPTQLGVEVPNELAGTSAVVQVAVNGTPSAQQTLEIGSASPGVFSVSSNGQGVGAITHADGSAISSQSPASRGEVVIIYATGLGAVSPVVPTGALPTGASATLAPATVTFGGIAVTPAFAGLSGCCVGLNQINVQVPMSVPSGVAVPVVLSIGGISSNAVTIALQ